MMAYTWSKALETGNTSIDVQHKELIQAVNNLLNACASGQGRAEISKTMQFLADYTAKHFSDEEQLQVKYKYPAYPTHKQYHKQFKDVVQQLSKELAEQGPSVTLVGKLNTQIGGWLVNHIQREDVKLAEHIRGCM